MFKNEKRCLSWIGQVEGKESGEMNSTLILSAERRE